MITALSVRVPERQRGIRALTGILRRDKVEITTKRARGVSLRHIVYTSYSGEVRLEKADEAVGMQRDRLLCSDKLEFPPSSGYKRFSSAAFSARLCENFALGVIASCKKAPALRIAIYDPSAYCAELLPNLLERCDDVSVVTDCVEPYYCAADRALSELGAAAVITRQRGVLSDRDFIIAPMTIKESLPVKNNAVLFTVSRPKIKIAGNIFSRYHFKMPNGFADIKPEELSEEYFCSALYTLGAQFELGSILPLSAVSNTGTRDAKALAEFLDREIGERKQVRNI